MTLVTVVTPTWLRHDHLVDRCIPSVQAQTWAKVEHIVVSDGPDLALRELLADQPVTYLEVPEHHTYPDGSIDYGSRPRNHALAHVRGDFVAYLDDDNAWRPHHLDTLLTAMVDTDADFAYSRMLRHPTGDAIGASPPRYGGIDTSLILHRAGLPQTHGMWPLPDELDGDKHAPDWGVVARWLASGATWVHVPDITVDYYFS